MLISSIVTILSDATDFYLDALAKLAATETYGVGSCSITWDTIINMNAMITVLSQSYANSLVAATAAPQLTPDQYEELLASLQQIMAQGF